MEVVETGGLDEDIVLVEAIQANGTGTGRQIVFGEVIFGDLDDRKRTITRDAIILQDIIKPVHNFHSARNLRTVFISRAYLNQLIQHHHSFIALSVFPKVRFDLLQALFTEAARIFYRNFR